MAEHEERVRLLEARIQTLTEDNDDLRRDNELAERHNRENDYWQDNQAHLIAVNAKLSESNRILTNKNKALNDLLAKKEEDERRNAQKDGKENGMANKERSTITQTHIRAYFGIADNGQ